MSNVEITTNNYKAASPEETVKKIISILDENKIQVEERGWKEHAGMFASLGLSHKQVPAMMTCGKGRNKSYARASAYAEFMERLQNLALFDGKIPEVNQSIPKVKFPDVKRLKVTDALKQNKASFRHLISEDCWEILESFGNTEIDCIPFYNVFTKTTTAIPKILLRLAVGSNGMCAGNTPEEALIQGICEVFERHFIIKLFSGEIDCVPVIPDKLCGDNLQKQFKELRSRGFEVYAKDCSLNGSIPTAGLLIVKGNKAAFAIGSAPHYTIALERCITELFQGMDFDLLEKFKMRPITSLSTCYENRNFSDSQRSQKHNYLKTLRTGSGVVHPILFDNSIECDPQNLSVFTNLHSSQTLFALLEPIKRLNVDLLVRDVSFLGFPTFQVYVPSMSEILQVDHERLLLYISDLPKAQASFRKIGKESNTNVVHLAKTLENLINNPFVEREAIISHLTTQCLHPDAILSNTEPEILLSMIWYKAENFSQAASVYSTYIQTKLTKGEIKKPPEYAKSHVALLNVLQKRAENIPLETALQIVVDSFGSDIANEIGQVFKFPQEIGDFFGIPECTDCTKCNLQNDCLTKDLLPLAECISSKLNQFEWDHNKTGKWFNATDSK